MVLITQGSPSPRNTFTLLLPERDQNAISRYMFITGLWKQKMINFFCKYNLVIHNYDFQEIQKLNEIKMVKDSFQECLQLIKSMMKYTQ